MPRAPRKDRVETPAILVDRLFTVGDRLPEKIEAKLVAAGGEVEPLLLSLIADDALYETNARGKGMAPVHALKLLGALRCTSAIPRMIQLLTEADAETYAYNAAHFALIAMGPVALEPCLAAHAASSDPEVHSGLEEVMAELGVRDERVYELLVAGLSTCPFLASGSLATYGDERAVPHLIATIDRLLDQPEGDDSDGDDLIELCYAVEELSGELSPRHRRQRELAIAARRARRAGADDEDEAPGRNDPCPCGSGLKYKKCCLHADEAS